MWLLEFANSELRRPSGPDRLSQVAIIEACLGVAGASAAGILPAFVAGFRILQCSGHECQQVFAQAQAVGRGMGRVGES